MCGVKRSRFQVSVEHRTYVRIKDLREWCQCQETSSRKDDDSDDGVGANDDDDDGVGDTRIINVNAV